MSKYVSDIVVGNKAIVDSAVDLGVDGIQFPSIDPRILSMMWMTKVELPGVELHEDSLWQMHESELMLVEDYDRALTMGWRNFCQEFYAKKLDNLMPKLGPMFAYTPQAYKNMIEAGIVPFCGGTAVPPLEMISGARSMGKFMIDLYRIPDKIEALFKLAMPEIIADTKLLLEYKPISIWVGGWRGASSNLSKKFWTRFVWPYMRDLAYLALEAGVVPVFHIDSDWSRDLEYFKEFPKGKIVIFPDGQTNIYKIKEVLGDRACINGDVPPALLTLGTPDEVYNYSRKLIQEIGPTGFMLGQGCDIPFNAKVENVKAMVAAARA